MNNQLLQQTEDAIRQKAGPQKQEGIDRVVDAGLKIMFSDGGSKLFKEQIDKGGDIIDNAAQGVAKLLGILYDQSKKTMPMDIAIPASTILMCEGLDFLEQAGRLKVTSESLAEATKAMGSYVLQLFGVTPDKMQELIAKRGWQGGAASAAPGAPGAAPNVPAAAATPSGGIIGSAMQGGV